MNSQPIFVNEIWKLVPTGTVALQSADSLRMRSPVLEKTQLGEKRKVIQLPCRYLCRG